MSEDEFILERYFGDSEKGVLTRLVDAGEHAFLHSCSGAFDEIRVGSPFCIPLEPALYSDLVPILREIYDKGRIEEAKTELPCESCPHRANKLTNCAPCCPSLACYIKSMPVKFGTNGRLDPRPCEGCEINGYGFSKNVCVKVCPSLNLIQSDWDVRSTCSDVASGGRHRRGKQGCP